MAVVRWTFQDLQTDEVWTFPFNASEGGTPKESKSIDIQSSTGINAQPILFEGPRKPKTGTFSGTTITQEHHEKFKEWFTKPYPIRFTDDLHRVFDIVIQDYDPTRVRAPRQPWRHKYVITYIILADYGVTN